MALSFIEKLKSIRMTEFSFVHFEKLMTSGQSDEGERKPYLLLTLETPVARVTSTTWSYDPNDSTERLHAFTDEVTEVRCFIDVIEKYESEFTFEEDADGNLTRKGTYAGDMILDLAKSGYVWLTDEPFAKMSSDWRKNKKAEQFNRIRSSILKGK